MVKYNPGDVLYWCGDTTGLGRCWMIVGSHKAGLPIGRGDDILPIEAWKYENEPYWVCHKIGHIIPSQSKPLFKARQQATIDSITAEFTAAKLLGNVKYQGF